MENEVILQFYEEFPNFKKVATSSNFCLNEVFKIKLIYICARHIHN